MRYFVLSDIHSNLEALQAVIEKAKSAGYDAVLCCGDIVGYGPNPVEVIDVLEDLKAVTIRGNHDRVAAGIDEATQFNPHARRAAYWTRAALPDSYRTYLAALPVGPLEVTAEAQLVHGALSHEDDYIFTEADAAGNLWLSQKRITFFGHSHFSGVYGMRAGSAVVEGVGYAGTAFATAKCDGSRTVLVNPGSVGQPRDGDSRASFSIWDTDREVIEFHRVAYDIAGTQRKMRAADLPGYLIDRLAHGR